MSLFQGCHHGCHNGISYACCWGCVFCYKLHSHTCARSISCCLTHTGGVPLCHRQAVGWLTDQTRTDRRIERHCLGGSLMLILVCCHVPATGTQQSINPFYHNNACLLIYRACLYDHHHHHHHHHQITKLSHSINAIGPAPHWSGRKREHRFCLHIVVTLLQRHNGWFPAGLSVTCAMDTGERD
jgi:hypothetical protein